MKKIVLFVGILLALIILGAAFSIIDFSPSTSKTGTSTISKEGEEIAGENFPMGEGRVGEEDFPEQSGISQPPSPPSGTERDVSPEINKLKSLSNDFGGLNTSANQLNENVEL